MKNNVSEHIHQPDANQPSIEILGAREHNLKSLDLTIPRNKLVVFTGLSGSGKSSLAFDTLFAEGQRRYLESFSAYARQFIGDMKRPDVDKVRGLSPVISIEQKTVSKNPRSTVGTVTEVYDFLRLLFARAGEAVSYISGEKMVKLTEQQIMDAMVQKFDTQKVAILAPVVKGRKGNYRDLFEQIKKKGYNKVRVDGKITDITGSMQVDRYKIHDIEVVIDRLQVQSGSTGRLTESVKIAMKMGSGNIMVLDADDQLVHFSRFLMDPVSGLSYDEPQPNSFSFNSPYGACPTCEGMGETAEVNIDFIIPDRSKSINRGGIVPIGELRENWTFSQLRALAKVLDFSLADPISKLSDQQIQCILYGYDEPIMVSHINHQGQKKSYESQYKGVVHYITENYFESEDDKLRQWAEEFMHQKPCEACHGDRLKQESLHFIIAEKNISQLSNMNIDVLRNWFHAVHNELTERQVIIATELIKEIKSRLDFLVGVGLGYLTLNSPARTLSGGEAQRIRLATQIGSKLMNVLYILDEPSIGLHQRDNERLIQSLRDLRDMGNTVLVVEHDKDMMLASDWLVEIGPNAGVHGGQIVASGEVKDFIQSDAITGKYLRGEDSIPVPEKRRKATTAKLKLKGCTGHNLKNVDLEIPVGLFVAITGVSGSGKSSLINETLFTAAHNKVYASSYKPLPFKSIDGLEHVDKVIRIDQSPIGRTPRSNPATYVGVFQEIRNLFTNLPEAKIRGYKPGRFSFNVKGGRCEACGGGGKKVIEMNFLPDVEVLCDECQGKRYNRETLEVRYKGKSINDVLEMSIDTAVDFFEHIPLIQRKVKTMQDVGLGYLALGQSSTTISGGEAQRVKLSTELSKRDTGKTLYILDEPTTGLHFNDIKQLLGVLNILVDKGNTIVVIEHNMDVIKVADWVVDIGPEGGSGGGEILVYGTPEQVAKHKESHTGRFLKMELK
ncbi:MAG: excinuclease ABC subunit A [Flavobacteriales bacterium]|nr:MAG: excinuclease ABC subunit A [Flavobacteriales bacterium]